MRVVFLSVLRIGLPVSLGGWLTAGLLLTAADLPDMMLSVLALLPLLTGCLLSGCAAARARRSAGLLTGICTALLLTALWYMAGCILRGRLCAPAPFPAAVLCGCAGGIRGVNLRAPLPKKRLKPLRYLRTRSKMLPLLLHTPSKDDTKAGNSTKVV
ncbi:MAG TPA: TIGR04086 family membrane protein [Ruminococcus sp.]|nr:TIGR04086 family membrane protein [Ruminococcus sp.]